MSLKPPNLCRIASVYEIFRQMKDEICSKFVPFRSCHPEYSCENNLVTEAVSPNIPAKINL
jgi:hypothetical protein